MHLARSSAMNISPIPLRLLLALTFIWAGLGKVVATMPVQGEQAALLANMGYTFPLTDAPSPQQAPPQPEPDQDEPSEPAPEAEDLSPPDGLTRSDPTAPRVTLAQQAAIAHSASEFPEPIEVRRLYGLALLTYNAAHPATDAEGVTAPPIWPEWAARDNWPIYIAWAAAITELVAGVLVLVGLLTRFSALTIAGVMATAIWLTQLGPAIQIGETFLGFLPRHDPWDVNAWSTLFWQIALFGSALALLFAGPGAFALDRAGGGRDDEFDDDDDEEDDDS